MDFENRVAVITGAARGIGKGIARAFAGEGALVVVADEDGRGAEESARLIERESDHRCLGIQADVSNPEGSQRIVDRTLEELGRIDVLVNNAGIGTQSPFLQTTFELWQRCVAVNLTGVFLCSQAAARVMASQRSGCIVNIASISGQRAGSGRTAYGTTKAGVIMLTRQMAIELAEYGIRVNAVAPGPVDTAMSREIHTQEQRDAYHRQIPLRRYGSVEEISRTVLFLASDDAGYITGETVNVDGGFVAAGLLTHDR